MSEGEDFHSIVKDILICDTAHQIVDRNGESLDEVEFYPRTEETIIGSKNGDEFLPMKKRKVIIASKGDEEPNYADPPQNSPEIETPPNEVKEDSDSVVPLQQSYYWEDDSESNGSYAFDQRVLSQDTFLQLVQADTEDEDTTISCNHNGDHQVPFLSEE